MGPQSEEKGLEGEGQRSRSKRLLSICQGGWFVSSFDISLPGARLLCLSLTDSHVVVCFSASPHSSGVGRVCVGTLVTVDSSVADGRRQSPERLCVEMSCLPQRREDLNVNSPVLVFIFLCPYLSRYTLYLDTYFS